MKIISDYPINENTLKDISEITKDYDFLVSRRFKNNDAKMYLSDSNPNKCRFCGKSFPEVTFKSESHTIPEFIGNKSLISKFECDSCNKKYFNIFENEFANFMLPHNIFSGTKSKKNKISKYKLKNQPEITNTQEKIFLSNVPDSIIHESQKDSLEIKIKIPSFIPEYIYRCLIKIVLSIIPEEKLDIYQGTLEWLMDLEIQSNIKPFMVFSMYPFNIQTKEIACAILERKDCCPKNIPHSIFFMSYNNFAFQTCIPYSIKEKIGVSLQAVPFIYPMQFDLNNNHDGMKNYGYLDLSSKEKITDKVATYTIKRERQIINKNTKR
ncbi:HNH endonuclease [Saccharicrinis sp. FJH2]|uniref:HNH endonuclease n=1 Tax=Saccharicrinis sp. FJH65 TaxID=3344659 RepID=UPI0035F3EC28